MSQQPDHQPDPPESGHSRGEAGAAAAHLKLHWYQRFSPGARALFWSIYFGIFVVAAVAGIVIALVQMSQDPQHIMHNPITSIVILVTGTIGEMWCLQRNLGIYMLGRPGKEYARWGVYIAGATLALSFLLAVTIVVLYLLQ